MEKKQTTKRATQDSIKQQTQLIGDDATDMGIKASTSPSYKGCQTRVEHSFHSVKMQLGFSKLSIECDTNFEKKKQLPDKSKRTLERRRQAQTYCTSVSRWQSLRTHSLTWRTRTRCASLLTPKSAYRWCSNTSVLQILIVVFVQGFWTKTLCLLLM